MIQESNGSLGYEPFGLGSWFLLPLKVNETSDLYPLWSIKRAIVEGPRRNSQPAASAAKRPSWT
jgi:hypothetical protein